MTTRTRTEFEEALVALCHAYQRWHDHGDHAQSGWLDARSHLLSLFNAALASRPVPAEGDAVIAAALRVVAELQRAPLFPARDLWKAQDELTVAVRALDRCDCGKSMAACADTEDCSGQSMPIPKARP